MKKQFIASVIATSVTIALCLALMIGATYAWFTDSVYTKTHISAGYLEVSLVRENLEYSSLGIVTRTDDKPFNFSQPTSENLFGLEDGDKLAPGDKLTADLVISNNSTTDFYYWIELVSMNGDPLSAPLREQLVLTVEVFDEAGALTNSASISLSESASLGSERHPLGELAPFVNDTASFSVTLEFLLSEDNNSAMEMTANIDLVVKAQQVVD